MSAARLGINAGRLAVQPIRALDRVLLGTFPLPKKFNNVHALYAAADKVNAFCKGKQWAPALRQTLFADVSSQEALYALTLPSSRLEFSTVTLLDQYILDDLQRAWERELRERSVKIDAMSNDEAELDATFEGQIFQLADLQQEREEILRDWQEEGRRLALRQTELADIQNETLQRNEIHRQIQTEAIALKERTSEVMKRLYPEWSRFWTVMKLSGLDIKCMIKAAIFVGQVCSFPALAAKNAWNK